MCSLGFKCFVSPDISYSPLSPWAISFSLFPQTSVAAYEQRTGLLDTDISMDSLHSRTGLAPSPDSPLNRSTEDVMYKRAEYDNIQTPLEDTWA